MRRLLILTALAALLLVPLAGLADKPKPAPAPAPAPVRSAEDIDWLSQFGLGGNPAGPAAGEQATPEQQARAIRTRNEALDRMRHDDPARYNRLLKIRRLCMEYRRADNPKRKAAIERELTPLVDQELRIQHENNKKRVAEMERRLNEAKKVLDEREDNWDKVVEFSVKEITGQNAYLRAVHHHNRNQNRRQR